MVCSARVRQMCRSALAQRAVCRAFGARVRCLRLPADSDEGAEPICSVLDARSLGCGRALAVLRPEPSALPASCRPYVLLTFMGGPQCGAADAFEPFGWEPAEGKVAGVGECVVQFVGDDDARRACDVDDT